MGWNLDILDERWVRPDGDAVVWEAGSACDLLVVVAPSQAGDLAAGVDGVDACASGGVPEVDVTIVRATTSGKEVVLPWAPRQSLNGGIVVGLLKLGSRQRASIPDRDKVVVATRCELATIWAPLKTAHLAGVGLKVSNLVLSDADIVVEEPAVACAS